MIFPPFNSTLKNGTPILVREVTQDDRHLLEFGFAHLSKRAKYFRFLGAHKDLSEKELDTFTATNTSDHVAVGAMMIATPEPEPIGIARYIRLPTEPHVAEIAITIADSYQRLGLGSLLLGLLGNAAKKSGITEFTALVDSENTAMLGMLSHFDGAKRTHTSPEIEVRFPISQTLDLQAARLRRENQKFKDLNKPASVWEDDGGAILKLFADLKRAIDKREIRSNDMSLSHQPACFSTLSQGAALFRLCLF